MSDDSISRRAAIDAIKKCRFVVDAIEKIRGLPSAQPEYYDYSDIEPLWKSFAEEKDINLTDTAKQLKEAMSAEVESLLRISRQVLESIPYHEKVLVSCDSILRELNPSFAKEKEQEEKIGALEERMGNIDDKLNKMFDLLSDTLEQRKPKRSKEE